MVSTDELSSIEGFDEELAKELINRANNFIEKIKKENLEALKSAGVEEYLLNHNVSDYRSTSEIKRKRNYYKRSAC